MEKILISWLTKLTNFVPDAGIWMNTQRPEWNDANNALVGNGTSMVTLYYMYRFTRFFLNWIKVENLDQLHLHEEVAVLLLDCQSILDKNIVSLKKGFDLRSRRILVDELGDTAEDYRNKAYTGFSGNLTTIKIQSLKDLFENTLLYLESSINNNKRKDGLFHAYNLISFNNDGLEVDYLYEMLEGQVAVLSSGFLNAEESLDLLDIMRASRLYRNDQNSYMLYPNRDLPGFLKKNHVPSSDLESNPLLKEMLRRRDFRIVEIDLVGNAYFTGDIDNVRTLKAALLKIEREYEDFGLEHFHHIEATYEKVFNHKAFTGRSGTFFAFEGLGSIYWHMVSKLLLAVQEILGKEEEVGKSNPKALIDHYYQIKAGIGIHKSPKFYGAFPMDPYSHTPFHKGAQQPGMTGQVKEDILNRWTELGVVVNKGCIQFRPGFIHEEEWLKVPEVFHYVSLNGENRTLPLAAGELAFTYCQVPIRYHQGGQNKINVYYSDKTSLEIKGNELSREISSALFNRSHNINFIEVDIKNKD
jgi:hypothetical protein